MKLASGIYPELSIIIVSYNVKELILKCLQSIYSNLHLPLEVIVVDNNSTDGTQQAITTQFLKVKLIANACNRGFSSANNQGFELSSGNKILLLNPDTELIDDSIGNLTDYLNLNPNDIVAPRLLNSDKTIQLSCWRMPEVKDIFYETFRLSKWIRKREYQAKNHFESFEVDCVSGASFMITRDFLFQIGLLDEDLFWMEDTDVCYRVRRAGGKVILDPRVRVIHHVGQSSKNNVHIALSNQLISKIKYFRKNSGRIRYLLVDLLIFIHIVTRMLILMIGALCYPKYLIKLNAYAYSLKKYLIYNITGKLKVN